MMEQLSSAVVDNYTAGRLIKPIAFDSKNGVESLSEIKEKMVLDDVVNKIDVVGGYLNFFIAKDGLVKSTLEDVLNKEDSFGIINKWRKKFDEIDVELPKLILWNAQSRNDTQLSDKNDPVEPGHGRL